MKNIAIIYHDADFDGKLSNEVCRFHLLHLHPEAVIYSYGWDYGRPVPMCQMKSQLGGNPNEPTREAWELYDAIYIVDLSVDELMGRPELRDKIVWIDHHKSAIEKWDHQAPKLGDGEPPHIFNGLRIDGVAACRLCWQWFSLGNLSTKQDFIDRKVKEPELIRLAGEYDIWDHRDHDAKALQFGLRALDQSGFDMLVSTEFSGDYGGMALALAIKQGRAIKSYCDKQNAEYAAAHCHTIKFHGFTMCALNIGQRGNSDLFNGGIKPEHQALFAWRHTGNGETPIYVSLYHAPGHEDIYLSKIATWWGGGGHKGACGFRISLQVLDGILLDGYTT